MPNGPVATIILQKLTEGLHPTRIDLVDDSGRHAGHHHQGGMDAVAGGESHFNLTVVSEAFAGQSRVMRQRAVNRLLAEELAGPVHALSIRALTPDEDAAAETRDR